MEQLHRMTRTRWLIVSLCAFALLVLGCGGSDEGVGQTGAFKIPDTTVVLDRDALGALESVSSDLVTFRFSKSTALLDRLRERDVIVSDVFEPHLPFGTLRRVTRITRSSGVELTTAPASLAEAIESGRIQKRIKLEQKNVMALSHTEGVYPAISPSGLYFGLNDEVVYDGGDGPNDQVLLNGNIAIEPYLDLDIDFSGFSLKTATIAIVGEVSGNVNIDAQREATLPGTPITLDTLQLGPFTVFAGPIPIVITCNVQLQVGVEGKVTAKMNVGFQADSESRIGFGIQNGKPTTIGEIDATASVELPSFEDGVVGTARLFAGPRLNVGVYGLPVGFAKLKAFVEADVDAKKNPWWCLRAGMQGTAGLDIEINVHFLIWDFTIEILDWETDPPLEKSVDLGCADGPAPSSKPGGGGTGEEAIQTFARSYGGDNIDEINSLVPTGDGGALLAGTTNSFSPTPRDAWLVKVDALGHVSWQLAYQDLDAATDVVELSDGYLFTAGRLGVTVDTIDLVRTDQNGVVLWSRSYGHADGVGPSQIVKTADGGFFVAGTRSSVTTADFLAARFDANGKLLWAKSYGGAENDDAHAAIATPDGGFLVVGETSSFTVTFTATWVLKLDGQGNVQWQRLFDQGGNFYGTVAVASPLGGYLIGGDTVGAGLLLRLDAAGAVTWARYYDAGTDNDYLMDGAAYPDGSFGVVGSRGLGAASELWVLRVSDPGNVLFSRAIGGANHESAGGSPPYAAAGHPVGVTADGGLLIGGNTQSWGTGYQDAWLLKVTKNGYVELDPQGGAASAALAGQLSTATLPGTTTTATAQALTLTEAPLEIVALSTGASVVRQGGLP